MILVLANSSLGKGFRELDGMRLHDSVYEGRGGGGAAFHLGFLLFAKVPA